MTDEKIGDPLIDSLSDQTLELLYQAAQQGAQNPGEALGFNDQSLATIEDIALGYYRSKIYSKAKSILFLVINMDHKRSTAWRLLGACHQAEKHYDVAVQSYLYALESNPKDVVSRVYLGECLLHLNELDKGLAELNQAIEFGKDIPDMAVYVTRARSLLGARQKTPQRIVIVEEGRKIAEEAAKQIAADKGDYASFEDLPDYDPQRQFTAHDINRIPALREGLAEIKNLFLDGKLSLGEIGGFSKKEMDGAFATACRYVEMGQVQQALQIIGTLLVLYPYEARFLQVAGICMQRLKRWDAADMFYTMAYNVDSSDPMTLIYWGETCIMSGTKDEGLEYVREGLRLAKENPAHHALVKRAEIILRQFAK